MLLAVVLTSLFLSNLPIAITTDLDSDKKALLTFSEGLPSIGNKLNWTEGAKVCEEWIGVTCTDNRVTRLGLPGKGLMGPIVANSIGKLDALETLSLRDNSLYGTIPSDLLAIAALRSIVLQHNNFCGAIDLFKSVPSPKLQIIDLSYNAFTGNIPPLLARLELKNLSLQHNSFSGPIPDLNVSKLRMLNLTYNNLEGLIPHSLHEFPKNSFIGNSRLCGEPLIDCKALPPAPAPLSIAPLRSLKVGYTIAFVASLMLLLF